MRRDRAGVVDQGRRLAQLEVPAHAAETDDGDLENISYGGEGDNFRVFGAHDSEDRWRVLLYNEPLPDNPDDRSVGSSCATAEDFANGLV